MFGVEADAAMSAALRLRHRLVPYLYTMNELAHRAGTPLVRPLYHADPRPEAALHSHNSFLFGTELFVAPLTTPRDRRTLRASVTTWLPAGVWADFFTGRRYTGGRFVTLHRTLDEYPVLAKAGAIVPLVGGDDLGIANPADVLVRVFAGADGAFTLYEDDDAADPVVARTPLSWDEASGTFTIGAVEGDASVLPAERRWTVEVVGVAPDDVQGAAASYDESRGALSVDLGVVDPAFGASFALASPPRPSDPRTDAHLFDLVTQLQVGYPDKHALWAFLTENPDPARRIAGLPALPIADDIKEVVSEVLLAEVP